MIESDRPSKPGRLGLSVWITAVLAVSAFVFLGFRLLLGLSDEDTDLYESPLILSVARQLAAGPGELYGPFGGRNPLVLIHAPLYYRLAALAAWPIAGSGFHPDHSGAGWRVGDFPRSACWRHSRRPIASLGWAVWRGESAGGPCC